MEAKKQSDFKDVDFNKLMDYNDLSDFKKKILNTLVGSSSDDDCVSYIKNAIKYHRTTKDRLFYDLQNNYDDIITNRMQLAESIAIKGLTNNSIYQKLYGGQKRGFNPQRENKTLTKKICLALKCKREDLVKPMHLK